jgi:WD40 repeat protein
MEPPPKMISFKDFLRTKNTHEQLRLLDIIRLYTNSCGEDFSRERTEKTYEYLTTFEFLESKLSILSVADLIKDYQLVLESNLSLSDPQRKVLDLISKSISQSYNILEYDKHQLPGILLGKLSNLDEPVIKHFLDQIKDWEDYPWLRPIRISIISPTDAMIRTLASGNYFQGMAISPGGSFAITTGNGVIKKWDLKTGEVIQTLQIQETYNKLRQILFYSSSFRDYTEDNVNSITDEELIKNIVFSVLAISPDGNWLATGSSQSGRLYSYNSEIENTHRSSASIEVEHTIFELWDLKNEQSVLCFSAGFEDRINSIALSSHAKYAVIGKVYGLTLVDIDALRNATLYQNEGCINIRSDMEAPYGSVGHEIAGINAVAISNNNQWFVAGNKNLIKIWDIDKGRLHSIIPLDSISIDGINFIKFTASYELLFSSLNGTIYRLSLEKHLNKELLNNLAIEKLSKVIQSFFIKNSLYMPYLFGHYPLGGKRANCYQLDFHESYTSNLCEKITKYAYNSIRTFVLYIFKRKLLAINQLHSKSIIDTCPYDICPEHSFIISESNSGGIELWNL